MTCFPVKRWLALALTAALLLCTHAASAAPPPNWKDSGFAINTDGMSLEEVLTEFSNVFGVRLSFTMQNIRALKGRLSGENGTDFMNRLGQAHKFRWFVYNHTLYVVPSSDNISMRLQIGEDAVQDAKSALIGLGLYDNRFGWGELPDEGIVMVSGPREYVNLARDILTPGSTAGEKKDAAQMGRQVMVFRLKYASATDRVINTRGQKETIPGIKTILTGLLNPDSGERVANDGEHGQFDVSSEKRSRLPKNGRGNAEEISPSGKHGSRGAEKSETRKDAKNEPRPPRSRNSGPRIDADATLNAIIIYDDGSKRDMYRALIAELDIEPQQVEIEALIVDIDRTKLAEIGVEWGATSGGMAPGTADIPLPRPGSMLLISNAMRFYANLKAMENKGDAHVLAKPTVLTLDNVAAVLDLSQTAYLPLVGERVADLANVTAGTMLRVVPRILREGANVRVRLEVDIEDGSLGDPHLKSSVTRSTISTQAIVDLQQTLMIGGYHSESTSVNRQKVPILGDAPLFGGLFRSSSDTRTERERLFLITPRLVGTTGTAAPTKSRPAILSQQVAAPGNMVQPLDSMSSVDSTVPTPSLQSPPSLPVLLPSDRDRTKPLHKTRLTGAQSLRSQAVDGAAVGRVDAPNGSSVWVSAIEQR